MRGMAWLGLLAIGWLLATTQVLAQTAPPAGQTEPDDEARRNFKVGSAAFEVGQYEDALRYFERAYALSPRPQLLYNIGQAADRLRVVAAGGVATAVIIGRNEPADRSPTPGTTGVVTYALELR